MLRATSAVLTKGSSRSMDVPSFEGMPLANRGPMVKRDVARGSSEMNKAQTS
jgi:hypothetical protein